MRTTTFREATDELGVPLEQIAEWTGRSYRTIQAYRSGERRVPADVWRVLAQHAERRSGRLDSLAARLGKLADSPQRRKE